MTKEIMSTKENEGKEIEAKEIVGFDFDDAFVTDKKKEVEGAWDEIYIGGETLAVLVARADNKAYSRMLKSEMTKNKRKLEREDQAATELFDRILNKVRSKTILLGWGPLQVNGKNVEYSSTTAEMLLTRSKDFMEQIVGISKSFELYKKEDDKEIQGN